MKKLLAPVFMTFIFGLAYHRSMAQQDRETEIRKLEKMEGEAWVNKDSATLFKLFSPELVVNAPINRVINLEVLKMLIRSGKVDISYSEKNIQKISFIGIDMSGAQKPAHHQHIDQYCADHGVFIIENLNNLDVLLKETEHKPFRVYTFPVNMSGFSGLPSRVIAEI